MEIIRSPDLNQADVWSVKDIARARARACVCVHAREHAHAHACMWVHAYVYVRKKERDQYYEIANYRTHWIRFKSVPSGVVHCCVLKWNVTIASQQHHTYGMRRSLHRTDRQPTRSWSSLASRIVRLFIRSIRSGELRLLSCPSNLTSLSLTCARECKHL